MASNASVMNLLAISVDRLQNLLSNANKFLKRSHFQVLLGHTSSLVSCSEDDEDRRADDRLRLGALHCDMGPHH